MRHQAVGLSILWLVGCGAPSQTTDARVDGAAEAGAAASSATDGADTLRALSSDDAVAEAAIDRLRRRGPAGLEALVGAHSETLASLRAGRRTARGERLRRAIDRVSGQRDGHASGLYWHTDLSAAKAEARRTGRPILSLRLLGRLDEEMSCANSRYFRIVLYSHPELADALRRDWVLHWSSERPAPRITIDMGDGRRIETTITGNSVHYVLNAEGRPLDALVGLYTPEAFAEALEESRGLLRCDGDARCLSGHHRARREAFERSWAEHDEIIPLARAQGQLPRERVGFGNPSATSAMELTVGKMIVETPLLRALGAERRPREAVDWERIGNVLFGSGPNDTQPLHPHSQALLRLKMGRTNVGDMAVRLAAIARADTARNEALFRLRVHELFVSRPAYTATFEQLNAYVYTRLLETPIGDPWLGLRAPDLYDGVEVDSLD